MAREQFFTYFQYEFFGNDPSMHCLSLAYYRENIAHDIWLMGSFPASYISYVLGVIEDGRSAYEKDYVIPDPEALEKQIAEFLAEQGYLDSNS